MSNTKISALSSGNPAQNGDEIPIARSGSNFKVTAGSIASLASNPTTDFMISNGFFSNYRLNDSSGVLTSAANQIVVYRFMLPVKLSTCTHVVVQMRNITGGFPAQSFAFAFYDVNGNIVYQSGQLDVPNNSFQVINFSIPTLTLNPGVYYLALTQPDVTGGGVQTLNTIDLNALAQNQGGSPPGVLNTSTVFIGISNHVSTGNVFPSTMGTLTAWNPLADNLGMPVLFFKP